MTDPLKIGETSKKYKNDKSDLHNKVIQDVERIFNDIRRYYEKFGASPAAGDFYVKEMDIRRRRLKSFWSLKGNILSLYSNFSHYGEDPRRTFVWLIILMLVSALFVYSYSNLSMYDSLLFSAYSLLLSFKMDEHKLSTLISFWRLFELVLGTSLITLFLLAIRRRFKR